MTASTEEQHKLRKKEEEEAREHAKQLLYFIFLRSVGIVKSTRDPLTKKNMVDFFQLEKLHGVNVCLEESLNKATYWTKFKTYIEDNNYLTTLPTYIIEYNLKNYLEPLEANFTHAEEYEPTDKFQSQAEAVELQHPPQAAAEQTPIPPKEDHKEFLEIAKTISKLFISKPEGDGQSYT